MNGNPQVEDGYTKIANELTEALAKIRISGEEWQVLWVIIRKTYGFNKKADWIPLRQFVELTGLNKPHIIQAIKKLEQKKIVTKNGNDVGNVYEFNKHYNEWQPLPKKVIVTKNGNTITKNGNESLPKMVPSKYNTKDNISKDNSRRCKTKIIFNSETELFENITELKIQKWALAYPGLDIRQSIKQMEIWLVANSKRIQAIKNFERFIVNWLGRDFEKSKGGKDGRNQKYIPISRKDSDEHEDRDIPAGEW
ncbi:MAG: replication protein [Ignavibacteriales bacterium]|nr:replication protein [Ignavibacteriales bacterium]